MMKTESRRSNRGARLIAWSLVLGAVAAVVLLLPRARAMAQEYPVVGSAVTMSSSEASLDLDLATGETRSISFRDGNVYVDGRVSGSYEPGGALESSWRELLRDPSILDAGAVDDLLLGWSPPSGSAAATAVADAFAFLSPAAVDQAQEQADVFVGDLGDGSVAIAPGIRSLDHLTRSMEQLHRSLSRIGSHALASGEDVALVIHDDYTIGSAQAIEGDMAVLDGDVMLEGTIRGDAIVLDGTLTLAEGARIEGDLLQVGGDVIDAGGRVAGELVSVSIVLDDLAVELEGLDDLDLRFDEFDSGDVHVRVQNDRPGFFGRIGHNIGHAIGGLAGVLAWWIGLVAFGAGLVYFFRHRLETVADTARRNLSRSFGVGLAGELLFVPIGLVLVVGIITWLVIPFYLLAAALAVPAGYLAIAHATGEVFEGRRYDWVERLNLNRSNSYWYIAIGLAVLLAPFAFGSVMYLFGGILGFLRGLLFFAGGVITWAAITTGVGALLLSRGGSSREYADGAIPDLFADLDDLPAEAPDA
ncbi:MAG: polymer-forming cytoskeletal protein [marine benthic group bacterium]|nr:polymer-forming cytoskeletal protein [Gemmatimonadota bacterium]MCL7968994.1 polymer-forming cytoskeletal protein [Gemmatimonadota bacterium]